jgi:hypothetical protein
MRDVQLAGAWLAQHGLGDTEPTPELGARLAVRKIVVVVDSVVLAAFIIALALVQVSRMTSDRLSDRAGALPLMTLAALVGGVLVVRFMLDRWVRAVDRRAAAGLVRRATHPVPPGWRTIVGLPRLVFVVASTGGALALAASALALDDPGVRDAAVVLLIGLVGAAAAVAVRIWHLLTRPVVADDADTLTADLIMRIEDARDATTPSLQWSLPMVLVFGTAPAWWNAVAVALVIGGVIALLAIQVRTPSVAAAARQAMATR